MDNNHHHIYSSELYHLQKNKRSVFALLSLFLLLLLAYNGATIFSLHVPFPSKIPPEPSSFSPENESRKWVVSSTKLYAVKEEDPLAIPNSHLPILLKSQRFVLSINNSTKVRRKTKIQPLFRILLSEPQPKKFSARVKEFLGKNCKFRFFMTWISSLDTFGDRELFTIESLFNSHPNGCLIIVSNSLDSTRGMEILKPFLNKGFRVTAISPDFDYLFKNTVAEAWFNRLKSGNVDPGEVSLGQNLSNVLRLGLLYKFGGIYVDTDVIVLRSFSKLRNVIGAQTVDVVSKNWTRLNNAVMVFDKGHPLLFKFIQEFALTFNGNKWGHNGPYLVSRVVSRVSGRPGYNFTVLPPVAFYPVDWSRIGSLFRGPKDEADLKWLLAKVRHIRNNSYVVHLWNKQSRGLKVEKGSVIRRIMSGCCMFCNSSASTWLL